MDRNNQVDPLYHIIRMTPASKDAGSYSKPIAMPLAARHFVTGTFTLFAQRCRDTRLTNYTKFGELPFYISHPFCM